MHKVAVLILLFVVVLSRGASGQSHPSSYIPMDDPVYSILDRMIARGELDIAGSGIRPWTRIQIASLLRQCQHCEGKDFATLRQEFGDEIDAADRLRLDSAYVRSEQILGTPLTNSFDYGQTIVNDFGRPNREGQNLIAGLQAHSDLPWMTSAVRVEFQHSGPDSLDARQLISSLDGAVAAARWNTSSVSAVRIVEGYVGTRVGNVEISAGKQNVHWGRGYSGAMLMGENAEPMNMLRIRNAGGFRLPGILAKMGEWRGEFLVGKLNGHVEPFSPWLQGQKITIAVTQNLEFGFSRTIVFAGGGRGLATSFGRSFISVGNNMSTTPGTRADVGDRRGGFDFQYRLPGLRKYVTLYADSFTDDDPSPLAAPHRAAYLSGIYLPQVLRLKKLDLRLECAYTDAPGVRGGGNFFYVNGGYAQSYTNNGQLLGHWVGRASKAYQGSATYWFSVVSKARVDVRTMQTSSNYLSGGGRQWDIAGFYESRLPRKSLEFQVSAQAEQWTIPALGLRTRRNLSLSFCITYRPQRIATPN